MNIKLGKALLAAALAAAMMPGTAATAQNKKGNLMENNPLMRPGTLPYGVPDFSKIKGEDYLPALKEGIRQQREEIARIVADKAKPTFANTILAYEKSGLLLDRVSGIFFALVSADKTPEIEQAEKEAVPLLTDFENEISFNQRFFQRIKYVYDHERNTLKGEDRKLLEEVYKKFVRSGALLPEDKMARM